MCNCSEITILDIYLFTIALILSTIFTFGLIILSRRKKIFDYPDERKRHAEPTPFLGGAAIYAAFWLAFSLVAGLCGQNLFEGQPFYLALLLSGTLVFLLGLADDFLDLKYYIKLIVQALAAVIMIAFGFKIVRLYIPFWTSFELGWLGYPITIIWVMVVANSINFIDGLDGLAGTVGLTVCMGLVIIAAFLQFQLISTLAAIIAGSLVGFLFFNRPPARIFLGNSGSLFLGFVFAAAAIICPIKSFTAVAMFVPLVAVALPLLETVTSALRRMLTGKSIFRADTGHIHYQLLGLGFSGRSILLVLGAISMAFNAFIPALFWFDRRQVFSIFVLFLVILVGVFFILKQAKGAGRS